MVSPAKKISNRLSLYSDLERNINTGKDIKTQFGLIFKKQCWEIDLNYMNENENEDEKVGIMINLIGLGEIETSVASW